MSQPTVTEIRTLLEEAHAILNNSLAAGSTATPNLVSDVEDFIAAAGSFSSGPMSAAINGAQNQRARMNALVTIGSARAMLDPLWSIYCDIKEIPDGSIEYRLSEMRRTFDAEGEDILARVMAFGSPSDTKVGGNTGGGAVMRCTVDEFGHPIEAVWPETKVIFCVGDQNSAGGGDKHEEMFEIRGEPAGPDQLERIGWGSTVRVLASSARNSILKNSSFDSWRGTAADAITAFPNWEVDTLANVEADSINVYRTEGGRSGNVPYGIRLTGAVKFEQTIETSGARFDPTRPVYVQIAYNRSIGSGAGVLTVRLGSKTVAIADLSAAASGWQTLILPFNVDSYLRAWGEGDATVEVELSGTTGGYTLIDDFIVKQGARVDNTFWVIIGNSTPFEIEDRFDVSDSATDANLIGLWLWRVYNTWFPAVPTGQSWNLS